MEKYAPMFRFVVGESHRCLPVSARSVTGHACALPALIAAAPVNTFRCPASPLFCNNLLPLIGGRLGCLNSSDIKNARSAYCKSCLSLSSPEGSDDPDLIELTVTGVGPHLPSWVVVEKVG